MIGNAFSGTLGVRTSIEICFGDIGSQCGRKSIALLAGVSEPSASDHRRQAGVRLPKGPAYNLSRRYVLRVVTEVSFKMEREQAAMQPPVFVLNLPSSTIMATQTMKGSVRFLLTSVFWSEAHISRSLGYPLGIFSDYSNHGTEFSIKIREKEHNWLEILTSDGQLYMYMTGRDRKSLFDSQGSVVLNVRNRALNFGGEYQVGQRNYVFYHPQFSDQLVSRCLRAKVTSCHYSPFATNGLSAAPRWLPT